MRYLSVCSGIEAASVAWEPLGWTPVAFSEIEPFAAAVLAHRFPNVPNLGDMTKHEQWPIGPESIDLLVGGTPCQSFSVAGLRKGLSDPRGGLMLTFLEIAQRLRPRWIVWENVPGVLSSGGGRDFGSFLGALGQLGYGWAYRVLDAQWVRTQRHLRAVPQRRRRVFVVGCLGDWAAAASILFERESVQRDSAPRRAPRQGTAPDAKAGVGAGRWWDGGECASTLTKQNANGAQRMPDKDNFGAVLQPVVIDRAAFNQGAHAQYEPHIAESEVMDALIARGPHAVGQPVAFQQNARNEVRLMNGDGAIAGSLAAEAGMNQQNYVAQPVAIQGNLIGRDVGGPHGVGASNDGVMYTLTKADVHGVTQPVPYDLFQITAPINRQNRAPGDPCHTLARDNAAHAAVAFPIDGRNAMRDADKHDEMNRQGTGVGSTGDPSHTVTSACVHAVAHAVSVVNTIDMQACKGNANVGDGSVSPTLCKPSGSDVHAVACPTLTAHNNPSQSPQSAEVTQPVPIQDGREMQKGQNGIGIGQQGDPAYTLDTTGAQAIAAVSFQGGSQQDQIITPDGVVPALAHSSNAHGGHYQPKVMQLAVAHTLRAEDFNASEDGTKRGTPLVPVACPTLTAHNDPSRSPQSAEVTQQVAAVHATTMTVRRLTPRECERLQGFPDDWTLIPWRKKPADECPDGPRYRALGNSMAVNCMEWIGERIVQYKAR